MTEKGRCFLTYQKTHKTGSETHQRTVVPEAGDKDQVSVRDVLYEQATDLEGTKAVHGWSDKNALTLFHASSAGLNRCEDVKVEAQDDIRQKQLDSVGMW